MNIQKFILSAIALLSMFLASAQPPPPPATPIDGGLSLLLAGGAAFGLKKILDKPKK